MTATAIESGVGNVWKVKQAALGTIQPSTDANTKQLRVVGEAGLKAAKTYGATEFVDGKAISSPAMYVDQIGGEIGSFSYQAQPETGGFAFAQVMGADVVTGTTPDYTHTLTFATSAPLQTYRIKVGQAVGPWRNSFYDSKVSKFAWNAGQEEKVATIEETPFALKAAQWYSTDPTATDSGSDPWNWNEATGSLKLNGTVFNELDGETVDIDRKIGVHRGDSPAPICFLPSKGEVNRTMTGALTDNTLNMVLTQLYGTTTPSDGQDVSTAIAYMSLSSKYTRTSVRSLQIDTNKVAVKADDFVIFPKDQGGKIPVAFGGQCLESSGQVMTVIAKTGDSAAYV
jgi:hypothetical protein